MLLITVPETDSIFADELERKNLDVQVTGSQSEAEDLCTLLHQTVPSASVEVVADFIDESGVIRITGSTWVLYHAAMQLLSWFPQQ